MQSGFGAELQNTFAVELAALNGPLLRETHDALRKMGPNSLTLRCIAEINGRKIYQEIKSDADMAFSMRYFTDEFLDEAETITDVAAEVTDILGLGELGDNLKFRPLEPEGE
jgi:hypothetical protein